MAEILLGNIKGPQGIQGETGTGFKVLDYYTTVDELTSAITNPSVGDAYGVGSGHPYDIYIYSPNQGWVNNGALQGAKGKDGTNATITDVTAAVDESTGTPTVTVTMGGTESDRSFAFSFSGLKGEKGEKGDTGDSANVDINEQTPTYTEATTLETLTSGEKIGIAFGKIKKLFTDFISHLADTTKHITSGERNDWNSKAPGGHGLGDRGNVNSGVSFLDLLRKGCGFYIVGEAEDTPYHSGEWLSSLQISRQLGDGAETGTQMAFSEWGSKPKMWLKTTMTGTPTEWYEMLHSGNISNLGVAKIATGSYIGTGTSGEANPNRLTFSIEPKIVIIYYKNYHAGVSDESSNNVAFGYGRQVFYKGASGFGTDVDGSDSTSYYTTYVLNGNVLEWYYERDYAAAYQMNSTGATYHYIAIG